MLLSWLRGQSTKRMIVSCVSLYCLPQLLRGARANQAVWLTVGCSWKQTRPAWVKSGNQAMPVCQSVMCRPTWLRSGLCETVTFLELVQFCKRCESVYKDILHTGREVLGVSRVLKKPVCALHFVWLTMFLEVVLHQTLPSHSVFAYFVSPLKDLQRILIL